MTTTKRLHRKETFDLYWRGTWAFDLDEQESALCREFAMTHNAKFGVFMANDTVTLQYALAAYNIGSGDEHQRRRADT